MSTYNGFLKIILGPMFSGKTTYLIDVYNKNKKLNISTLVVNYSEDTRYHNHKMSTHDQIMVSCVQTKLIRPIVDMIKIKDNSSEPYDTILINEGQFFCDLYVNVKNILNMGKNVYVCGLDGDFKMEKFGKILDIIPLANEVEKLKAKCKYCKNNASFTKRISNETDQKVIGSYDKYAPVCRNCHYSKIDKVILKSI